MRSLCVTLLCLLALASCGSDLETTLDDTDSGSVDATDVDAEVGATEGVDIDLSLTRDDVGCSPEAVGGDTDFTTVHVVVDGVLGETCLGTEDATLYAAWEVLATIAPTTARADLALFGGFGRSGEGEGDTSGDEVTLAFVNAVDDDGTVFQMSINLASFEDDEDESYLTVAHEFSHVFTLGPPQIDRAIPTEECDTFDNGEGCFFADALLAQWVDLFWTDEMLSTFNPFAEATGEAGEPRCDRNAEFLGPYAASSPDEDFAETFAAFVFDVEVDPALEPKLAWMDDQPGLVEFRERARSAGLSALTNTFELCG